MDRLSTKQTLAMLGLTHRNSLHARIEAGELTPIVDRGRNYYDRAEVERYIANKKSPPISDEEAHRRAQEAAEYADKGIEWPPR
ncbi:hypothetical protein [Mesorhizobium sp.]|uniref:hypothetical protein n=1 Tax=Mesorhizobium sp. TaxID=1871066 RepID=UPI001210F5EE|nr:hypothetical protein [Mesorhizobium sp.]TIL30299.1 MAG: helix-turn-helix domain-containing protein [Mesorhizobium sp.]TIL50919.1 MAG: helix-turn-helix domain-containing protein [Mesorhizobium sp.]TIL94861.1 MAG: helix-turn-helix domain-containing protein [Mesorhizobium sp.]